MRQTDIDGLSERQVRRIEAGEGFSADAVSRLAQAHGMSENGYMERIAELMLKEKNLHANVDFYSATVYYSLGIPTDLFTPIFAISRTAGWTAHVLEQLADNRLIRPQSQYSGPVGLKVAPIEER